MYHLVRNKTNPQDLKSLLAQVDATCEEYLVKKAPFALPENVKEAIVKYAPYVSVVLAILLLPVVLFALGLGAIVAPFALLGNANQNPLSSLWGIVSVVFSIAGLFLWIKAIPGLFARTKQGWTYSFWTSIDPNQSICLVSSKK